MSSYNAMDKVIDNLWVGTHIAAQDAELLQRNGVKSILTVMRGKLAITKVRCLLWIYLSSPYTDISWKPFARHQIPLDDTDDADALVHFPACNHWIDTEIKKGRGVLVHCQVLWI